MISNITNQIIVLPDKNSTRKLETEFKLLDISLMWYRSSLMSDMLTVVLLLDNKPPSRSTILKYYSLSDETGVLSASFSEPDGDF